MFVWVVVWDVLMLLGYGELWRLDVWVGGFRDICCFVGIDCYSCCVVGVCILSDFEIKLKVEEELEDCG